MKPDNKSTPGPWKVEKYPYDKIFICRKRGIKNSVIAEIGNNFENENNNANATLIAAAPEMLEALELLLNDNRLMNAMSKEQSKAVLYAVAKARGE